MAANSNATKILGNVVTGTTGTTSTNLVYSTSPILVTPTLGVANATSVGVSGIITTGANGGTNGSVTFSGSTSGSTVLQANVAAGGTLTLPTATGTLTSTANNLSVFASTTSAQLAGIISDETGSGALVFGTGPTVTLASASTAVTQTPSDNSTKLATTAYVDAAVLGQNFKEAALVATTANLVGVYLTGTFTYTATGTNVIDGVTLALGNRVLVKNQTTTFQNGIYVVTTAGALGVAGVLTRSSDANSSTEFKTGDSLFVTSGTANSNTTWAYTGIDNPTIGTTAITYAQTAGQGTVTSGNGITVTGLSVAIDTSVTVDKTTAQTLTSKTLTSPVINTSLSGTAFGTGIPTFLATPSSANLIAAVTDETGSGSLVFATSPTLVTPVLGAATGTSLQLSGLTASSALATDASKNLVSVANTGTGNNVLATAPSITGATLTTSSVNGVTLTAAGSTSSFLNASGAYSSPTVTTVPQFQFSTIFETAGRFSQGTAGGGSTITFNTNGALVQAAAGTNASATVTVPAGGNFNELNGNPTMSCSMDFAIVSTQNTPVMWCVIGGNVGNAATTNVGKHIGFDVIFTAGSGTLSYTQADGTTQTTASMITGIVQGDYLDLVAQVTASGANYYARKNGGSQVSVLAVASHLPTGNTGALMAVSSGATSSSAQLNVNFHSMSYSR